VPNRLSRSPRHRLIRSPYPRRSCAQAGSALLIVALAAAACSSGGGAKPTPRVTTPSPSPTAGPKPGGTLRIAGVTRILTLDPAAPANEQALAAGPAAVSPAQGSRLIGRLLVRQLYSYPTVDPAEANASPSPSPGTVDKDLSANGSTSSGPVPDLAGAQPKITDGGRLATITLRTVRWDVPSGRRVTANDELRALKRLCLPQISSQVRGYLEESVTGYAAACRQLAARPPKTLAELDAVTITGLTTQGDTTLRIQLLRPTNDLTDILSLPETAPLPVESFVGVTVTNDPQVFVGDGPYRFVAPQSGETYALSRNPSWSPGSDPLRHAYVDHVSVRGGMTAAKVTELVQSGGADLALDVPAAAASAASTQPAQPAGTDTLITTASQGSVVLAVGSRGPAAQRLGILDVRRVLAACIDATARGRIAAALGAGIATSTDELLDNLSLTPDGKRTPTPSPSASPSASASASASVAPTPSASGGATARSSSPQSSPSVSQPLPPARCARTAGVTGATLRLLIPNTPQSKAAAAVIAARLAVAGVRLRVVAPTAAQYTELVRLGGWDLLLAVRPIRYPAPRALLAPLLDGTWPGTDAVALRRSPQWLGLMLGATAERQATAAVAGWQAVDSTLSTAAVIVPLAQLSTVYPRGPNVEQAPISPLFANADPANVALGSTRPGDPARTPTPTP
jgi:peptide/nickel transport system substrate-binding protein